MPLQQEYMSLGALISQQRPDSWYTGFTQYTPISQLPVNVSTTNTSSYGTNKRGEKKMYEIRCPNLLCLHLPLLHDHTGIQLPLILRGDSMAI